MYLYKKLFKLNKFLIILLLGSLLIIFILYNMIFNIDYIIEIYNSKPSSIVEEKGEVLNKISKNKLIGILKDLNYEASYLSRTLRTIKGPLVDLYNLEASINFHNTLDDLVLKFEKYDSIRLKYYHNDSSINKIINSIKQKLDKKLNNNN